MNTKQVKLMATNESLSRIRGALPMIRFISSMVANMVGGLYTFRKNPNTVTIYGSARLTSESPYYQQAMQLGEMLAKNNISIITGAGPGIMEAANKGAFQALKTADTDVESCGCNIILPHEQRANPYLTKNYQTEFFFVRKFLLRHTSRALIAFPGGFGTMDELFECLTLIRTKSTRKMPTILVGRAYWQGLLDYLSTTQVEHGTISKEDVNQLHLTDDLNEVLSLIKPFIDE